MNRQQDFKALGQFLEQFEPDQRTGLKQAICEEFGLRACAIDHAVSTGQTTDVRDQAHGVKGTAATFLLTEISGFASQIEIGDADADLLNRNAAVLAGELRLYVDHMVQGTGVAKNG